MGPGIYTTFIPVHYFGEYNDDTIDKADYNHEKTKKT